MVTDDPIFVWFSISLGTVMLLIVVMPLLSA